MEISFEALSGLDLGLMRILGMPLRQRPQTVVQYDAPGREDHILHYHLSGVRVYQQQGREVLRLQPGEVILLPMGARYTTSVEGTQDAMGYNVRFLLQDAHGRAVGFSGDLQRLAQDEAGRLLPHFQRLAALSVQAGQVLAAKAELSLLLDALLAARAAAQENNWFSIAAAYMSAHLQGPLSLQELCRVCCMSERTFCRRFKAATGQSPIAWHRRLRIRKAQEFLETGACTLETVAEALGFTDAAHLSRCYFRETGQHAGVLRRMARP